MAEVCTLDWHIIPFRADRFLDNWEPVAAKAPAFGAKSWSLIRSIDDPLKFRQTMVWESRADFERYWYADEVAEARAAMMDIYDIPLLPAWHTAEMLDQTTSVCAATSLPVIADADTGYGNAVNAERTMLGYTRAGAACVMIEDQTWPKRCGHTAGKTVVDRSEAVSRVRACVEIREGHGLDVLIMARTDAVAAAGFDEAMFRVEAFAEAGADLTFLEAPESVEQMARYCAETPGHKTANLVEDGRTPWLEPQELAEIGYSLALYPVSLLLHGIDAMGKTAEALLAGSRPDVPRCGFDAARAIVGWPDYETRANRFGPG